MKIILHKIKHNCVLMYWLTYFLCHIFSKFNRFKQLLLFITEAVILFGRCTLKTKN